MNDVVVCLVAAAGFDKAAQGLSGAARRLADQSAGQLCAIIIGAAADVLAPDVARIADKVILADQVELTEYQPETWLNALTQICSRISACAVLFSNDSYSQELAPRLAYRLGGSAAGDVIDLRPETGELYISRQVYGGKALAIIKLKRNPAVAWLRARAFAPASPRAAAAEITRASLDVKLDARTRILERKREGAGQVRLEDARIIVAGGRGIGGAEGFTSELQPLAESLGGQPAATRAACDAGWVPPTWQVGQTGKKVAPDLYLAIAISGASQHMAGISEAKNIAAINTDPEAPIFNHCRFGMVADYRKVVPLLRRKLAALCR